MLMLLVILPSPPPLSVTRIHGPWQALSELSESPEVITQKPAFIVFMEGGDKDEQVSGTAEGRNELRTVVDGCNQVCHDLSDNKFNATNVPISAGITSYQSDCVFLRMRTILGLGAPSSGKQVGQS